ncbi:hypothetical protein RDI58_014974 [Solanum bulbocastanum]|uniref:Leucine-rich repeat-containing N-terminal plant-type domain-containing protein n=1 Tax=Solanum bulbocastanum TaxID=147425 RepID=A0AAN8TEF0_SOLBU
MAPLKLKENLTGPSGRLSSWIDQQDYCQWFGVTLSSFLGNLSNLQVLDLGGLDISKATNYWVQIINDHIPSLLELHFPRCKLLKLPSSFPSLNLSSFLVLDLSDNAFNSSTFPQWIFKLNNLVHLDLSSNNIFSELPNEFSKLTFFEYLDLSFIYGINGTLKRSLGKLCNLKTLILSYNILKTQSISSMPYLNAKAIAWTLEFIFNDLTGNLLDTLRNLWKLRDLQFRYNSLTGTILETIRNLSSFETFYLTSNKMSGNLTTNIGQLMSLVSLDISENMWEGIVKYPIY